MAGSIFSSVIIAPLSTVVNWVSILVDSESVRYGRTVSFTVFGKPAAQGSVNAVIDRRSNKAKVLQSKKVIDWREQIAWAYQVAMRANADRWDLIEGPVELVVVVYSPRPKRPKFHDYPAVVPDADKLLRAVGDALTGQAYKDDCLIVNACVFKRYSWSGEPARVEILVREILSVAKIVA